MHAQPMCVWWGGGSRGPVLCVQVLKACMNAMRDRRGREQGPVVLAGGSSQTAFTFVTLRYACKDASDLGWYLHASTHTHM